MTGNGLCLRSTALLIAFGFATCVSAQTHSESSARPSLRLAAPLPTPPFNVPPLQIGSHHAAPVMPAAPPQAARTTASSPLQSTAPKLMPQSTVYLAEPPSSQTHAVQPMESTSTGVGGISSRFQQFTEDKLAWMNQPANFKEAKQAGQARVQTMRQATDFALGIHRCPQCGKRRPEHNRLRIGVIRVRDFIRTGKGEEKVAWSPNAGPAS